MGLVQNLDSPIACVGTHCMRPSFIRAFWTLAMCPHSKRAVLDACNASLQDVKRGCMLPFD
jgi:hypothetical protein